MRGWWRRGPRAWKNRLVGFAGISREGLQQHGGWADTQMPDRIYADQQAGYAQDEARDIRAIIRGETPDQCRE